MRVLLYADGSFSHATKSGGYATVVVGDLEYRYSEMIAGCVHAEHMIEFVAFCESITDLASRLKYKTRLDTVDLVAHSDNDSVLAVFQGRKVIPTAIRQKYPYIHKLLGNFRSFTIKKALDVSNIYLAECDRLSKIETAYMVRDVSNR